MGMLPRRMRALLSLTGACTLIISSVFLIREAHHSGTNESVAWPIEGDLVWRSAELSLAHPSTNNDLKQTAVEATVPLEKTGSPQQQQNAAPERSISFNVTTQAVAATETAAIANETLSLAWTDTATANPLDQLKVPHPIFVASLPKSGTTSTARYFYCGDIWTAHTFVNTIGTTHLPRKQMRVGHCFFNNVQAGRPPLQDCGNYVVWSDAGHPRGTPCFYPSVHGLNEFYAAYPNATILLVTRNSTAWSNSVLRWKHGELVRKWRRCEHFPKKRKPTELDLEQFYNWHAQNLRDFAAAHPSMTYVEVALEDEAIGEKLEEHIGVRAECFGHHNSHEKRMRLNPRFRRQFNAQLNKTSIQQ